MQEMWCIPSISIGNSKLFLVFRVSAVIVSKAWIKEEDKYGNVRTFMSAKCCNSNDFISFSIFVRAFFALAACRNSEDVIYFSILFRVFIALAACRNSEDNISLSILIRAFMSALFCVVSHLIFPSLSLCWCRSCSISLFNFFITVSCFIFNSSTKEACIVFGASNCVLALKVEEK